ncbi:MAG: prepilin peptidase [Candidatus Bathyarchaeia archaeon]|jgi:Flp pilus assembly protein protease CpaA
MNSLAVVSAVVVLACFGFAGWQDFKTRLVSNWVWLVLCVFGVPLALANYVLMGALVVYVVNASVAVLLGFAMFFLFGRFFGGADAKALMALGLTVPLLVPFVVLAAFPVMLIYCLVRGVRRGESLRAVFGVDKSVPFVSCLFVGLAVLQGAVFLVNFLY